MSLWDIVCNAVERHTIIKSSLIYCAKVGMYNNIIQQNKYFDILN